MDVRPRSLSNSLTLQERWGRVVSSLTTHLKRDRKYLARVEFWVYLPGEVLPPQDEIMNRMMQANPHKIRGVSPIGAAEGMLFSDVRTHIALVRQAGNPQVFRGSNFPGTAQVTPENLETIANCKSIAKVSYISEQPLHNLNHVAFVTHAADAIADLAEGYLVYDRVAETLFNRKEFGESLDRSPKGNSSDFHVRMLWEVVAGGSRAETRGLRKVGLPDLISKEMSGDQRVVTASVLEEAAGQLWTKMAIPDELMVEVFGDRFKLQFSRHAKSVEVRILRVHEA